MNGLTAATRLQGLIWRAHHPRWAFQPDLGEGAAPTHPARVVDDARRLPRNDLSWR